MHEHRAIWPVGLDWVGAREKRNSRREKRKSRCQVVDRFFWVWLFSSCCLRATRWTLMAWYASALLGQVLHASVDWLGLIYGHGRAYFALQLATRCYGATWAGLTGVLLIFYRGPTRWKIARNPIHLPKGGKDIELAVFEIRAECIKRMRLEHSSAARMCGFVHGWVVWGFHLDSKL